MIFRGFVPSMILIFSSLRMEHVAPSFSRFSKGMNFILIELMNLFFEQNFVHKVIHIKGI